MGVDSLIESNQPFFEVNQRMQFDVFSIVFLDECIEHLCSFPDSLYQYKYDQLTFVR